MSCKEGGVMFKTHVRVTGIEPPPRSTELTLPQDIRAVSDLPDHIQRPVLRFLLTKNMDLMHFPGGLFYSDQRKRLLVPTAWGWLGRDTTENSPQKWLTYQRSQYLGTPGPTTVIVEDPFSYFKILWAIKYDDRFKTLATVCSLGTNVKPALFVQLLGVSAVGIFFDGDRPGADGSQVLARRLTALGIRAVPCCARSGKDPKDLSGEEIRNHLIGAQLGL